MPARLRDQLGSFARGLGMCRHPPESDLRGGPILYQLGEAPCPLQGVGRGRPPKPRALACTYPALGPHRSPSSGPPEGSQNPTGTPCRAAQRQLHIRREDTRSEVSSLPSQRVPVRPSFQGPWVGPGTPLPTKSHQSVACSYRLGVELTSGHSQNVKGFTGREQAKIYCKSKRERQSGKGKFSLDTAHRHRCPEHTERRGFLRFRAGLWGAWQRAGGLPGQSSSPGTVRFPAVRMEGACPCAGAVPAGDSKPGVSV